MDGVLHIYSLVSVLIAAELYYNIIIIAIEDHRA